MKSRPVSLSAGEGQPIAPANRTLRCQLVTVGASRPQSHLGDAPPRDMYEALGIDGQVAGSKTSTLLLATLGSCLLERIRANATIGNIEISKLVLEVEAEMALSPL